MFRLSLIFGVVGVIGLTLTKSSLAQMRKADFLSLGLQAGQVKYQGQPVSNGVGPRLEGDAHIAGSWYANVGLQYLAYQNANDQFSADFGLKFFGYKMLYLHPYVGYNRIITSYAVKRGSLGLGLGGAVPLPKRHLNFEIVYEVLPFYGPGVQVWAGRFTFPFFMFYPDRSEKDRFR
ncbi:MAG: hypothetical protein FJ343_04640 [Sphingomonadales bacterium]|nr:hypothetical protein [Sphingomonadales bacterium]